MSQKYDSTADTTQHVMNVRRRLALVCELLRQRAIMHDASKFDSPEKEIFDAVTERLRNSTYGSDEYKATLAEMKPALDHHYAANSHHPEHYANGVDGMSLLDLVEMFCDWKAATERHNDGSLERSIQINRERFNLSPQLASILENTRRELDW